MNGIYINKTEVSESLWEALCESALGCPLSESTEILDVVYIKNSIVIPCESKSNVDENGKIFTQYIETTNDNTQEK